MAPSSNQPPVDLIKVVHAAASAADATPVPARHGRLGFCCACSAPIATHFDTEGRFLGCAAVSPETVFVLVPYATSADETGEGIGLGFGLDEPRRKRTRSAVRGRYFPSDKAKEDHAVMGLSDRRRRVLQAILDNSRNGILAREIIKKAKLPHGSVQEALSFLRKHDLAELREDGTE